MLVQQFYLTTWCTSLEPTPHPLARENKLVYQVEFSASFCVTQQCSQHSATGYQSRNDSEESCNFIGHYHISVIRRSEKIDLVHHTVSLPGGHVSWAQDLPCTCHFGTVNHFHFIVVKHLCEFCCRLLYTHRPTYTYITIFLLWYMTQMMSHDTVLFLKIWHL